MCRPNKSNFKPDWTTCFWLLVQLKHHYHTDKEFSPERHWLIQNHKTHIKARLSTQNFKHPVGNAPLIHSCPCNTKVNSGSLHLRSRVTDPYPNPTKWISKSDFSREGRRLWALTYSSRLNRYLAGPQSTHRHKMLRPFSPLQAFRAMCLCSVAHGLGRLAYNTQVFRVPSQPLFPNFSSWSISLGLSSFCLSVMVTWPLPAPWESTTQ